MIQRVLAAAVLVVLGVLPAQAAPITITDVSVTIGPFSYTAASVGWNFSGGGVTLQAGEDLVLAQNFQGFPNQTTSYNFDTSDAQGPQNFAQISITANGVTTVFNDANQVLNLKGLDLISLIDNESQEFGLPINGPGYAVFLGYADNVHAGDCGGWASSLGLNGAANCIPSGFFGATYRQSQAGLLPEIVVDSQVLPNHCLVGLFCYESGVIRILNTEAAGRGGDVPEPATLTLLAVGLAGVGRRYWRQRQAS